MTATIETATVAPVPAGGRTRRTRPTDTRVPGQKRAVAALLAPFAALCLGVFVIPAAYAIYLSFFSTSHTGLGFGNGRTVFVGFRNFLVVLTDPSFLRSIGVTFAYVVLYIPLLVVGSLLLALLFDSGLARARQFAQTALYLPHAVPGIIASIIWLYLYTPGISPVLAGLAGMNIQIELLGQTLLIPSMVNIALWGGLGYNMVIFYAALQAVPRELMEAAAVDGAGPVRTALQVKVPLVRASVVTVSMFTLVGSLQLFTEPMLLMDATPLIGARFTPNMYIYDAAFNRSNYGLASAASVLLLVVCCLLSYAVARYSSRGAKS
jgi:multiple sugar transport system permease protein